jgi:hypothetical protein
MNISNQRNNVSSSRTSEKKTELKSTSSRTNEKTVSDIKKPAISKHNYL